MKVFFRTWQKQENTDKHTPRLITIMGLYYIYLYI